jgi:predicted MPP superfamily phosphohydrolase
LILEGIALAGWKYLPFFFIIVDTIVFGVQLFFYLKALKWAKESKKPKFYRYLSNSIFFVFNVPLITIILFKIRLSIVPDVYLYSLIYPFYLWHFSLILLFFGYVIIKILGLPFASATWFLKKFEKTKSRIKGTDAITHPSDFDQRRRKFIRSGATVLAGTAFAGSAYGTLTRNDYEISNVTLPIINLPENFQGFTITLLTDIHSSIFMEKEEMKKYVKVANNLDSDLVAVGGDFVNSTLEEVYPFAEAFSELKARYGVHGVLGNHDYFTGHVDELAKEVDNCGINLLLDDKIAINKGGEKIYLLGADDTGTPDNAARHFDVILRGVERNIPKILVCHRPYFFRQAAERGIDVTLAGHTHGGQIVFARIGKEVIAPTRLASPYVEGLYTRGTSKMYVSRGIGTVGIPIRINCPPEITKFTLVKA